MNRNLFAAVAILPLLVACSVDRGVGPHESKAVVSAEQDHIAPDPFALGSNVLPSGAMPQDAAGESFARGSAVFLSVDMRGASTAQEIRVDWVDPHGRLVRRDRAHAPEGSKYVVFTTGATHRWAPGPHRAVVVIDGRKVSERAFDII